MLRNEALQRVKNIETISTGTYHIHREDRADHIARQIAGILAEESIYSELLKSVIREKKSIPCRNTATPESRKVFFDEMSRASHVFLGIEAAIGWLVEEFEKESGIRTDFQKKGDHLHIDNKTGYFLFSSTQELLTNVGKHADANNVLVSIEEKGNSIEVNVEDNGRGFDTSDMESFMAYTSGFGFAKLCERVKYLDGQIYVESKQGEGTRITLAVPSTVTKQ